MPVKIFKPDSFSYEKIEEDKELTIPEFQQMTTHGTLTLNGTLNIDGGLAIRT